MKRRTFLKFGSSGVAGLALGGMTRTPLFRIGNAFACSTTAWKFGVLGDTQWTQHPGDSSTETSAQDPTGLNPNSVSVSIINKIDSLFVSLGVKFVIQVGDLTDCGTTAAIQTRALAAQTNLNPHQIGFFPIRGNHETYGGGYGDLNQYAIPAIRANFPQTQGNGTTWGAHNFSSATDSSGNPISDLKGISYCFDYGHPANNARFLMLDCWATQNSNPQSSQLPNGTNNADGYAYGYTVNDQQKWISKQLNYLTRGTEHAFVFSHQPLMAEDHQDTIFSGYTYANPAWQNAFYASLHNNGVKYYISGHDHMHQRSIIASPDGKSQVEELICASCSGKFYTPNSLSSPGWVDPTTNVNQKSRETSVSQELYTVGFYIFTVDGPIVTVDYYSDTQGNWYSDSSYPNASSGPGTLITPTFNFTKKETWGYSNSPKGVSAFQLNQGSGYNVKFGSTTAQVRKQGGTASDYSGRSLAKDVEAWWAHKNSVTNADAVSDVLTLVGAASAAIEQNHNPANTFNSDDPVAIIMTYDASVNRNDMIALGTMNNHGKWVNAVDLNFGGAKNFVPGPWTEGTPLGSYGFDPKTHTAWAVVNHDSDFAVIKTRN
ncbi:MAG: metallophosphoesterase [Syntrophobacteraceae bacterium]|jgi:hypothetical protein